MYVITKKYNTRGAIISELPVRRNIGESILICVAQTKRTGTEAGKLKSTWLEPKWLRTL